MATPFSYANTITAATPAVAAEVQGNFDDLLDWIDAYYQQTLDTTTEIDAAITASAVLIDGSNAMTGDLDMGGNSIVNSANTTTTTWTAVTYENSWSDYLAGYQGVEYRKNGDNVEIRGMMKGGSIVQNAFTLPVGFRPPEDLVFNFYGGSQWSGLFVIRTDGTTQANVADGGNLALVTTDYSFSVTA